MTDTSANARVIAFREQLSRRVMVADGAMGTMLYDKGVFINRCYDELNLSSPDMVRQIHLDYVKAGAEILETNTFGANRMRLAAFGLGEKLKAINQAGVRLAREAGRDAVFVAGAMGPLGANIEPLGPTSFAEARSIFREQAECLVEAGVDLLILETFYNLDELREAIFAAREVAGPEMVIVGQVTIDDYGNLRGGADTETFTKLLDEWPVDVIGTNCSAGPKVMLETIEKMMQYSKKPMSAMPNAGHPQRVEGRHIYLCSPEYMAQYARRFLWAGVKIIGGCCGTTPEHIKLIRSEARSLQPGQASIVVEAASSDGIAVAKPVERMAKVPVKDKSQLGAKLAAGKFVAFVEILPPRGVDASKEIAGAALCKAHGIDCINVPDGPRASAAHERAGDLPVDPARRRHRGGESLLLPGPQYTGHPVGIAGRTCGGRAEPDLHHRRSAAHGPEPERDRRVRRGRDRPGEHREQFESRARYRRRSHGIADRAAARRGREPRRVEHGRGDSSLRAEGESRRRVRRHPARLRSRPARAIPQANRRISGFR